MAEIQDPADLQRSWRFERADLEGTGTATYIVALYSNGLRAVARVISVTGGAGVVVAAPDDPMLDPSHMGMKLIDLDGDGKPEIVLSSSSMRRTENWIFAWRNHALVLISPTRIQKDGTHLSLIPDLRLVDVDGDGRVELLTRDITTGVDVTYALTNGAFSRTADTLFVNDFTRGTGEPNYWDIAIPATDLTSQYELRVINGKPTGTPVTSATIALNGRVIFQNADFKHAAITLKASTTLISNNELEVEVAGAPGSSFRVVIVRAHP